MITLPGKYVMSLIGAAVSISGFVALVTTPAVKTWVKNHPYPIYFALIVAVLVITGTLDYAYNLRKRITVPSDHDRNFYAAALERLPPNGTVIGWLKRSEMTEASIADFPADVLGALERTTEFFRTQSVGFDDTRIAGSFESLTGAITSFCQSVDRWTFAAHARQFRHTGTSVRPISATGFTSYRRCHHGRGDRGAYTPPPEPGPGLRQVHPHRPRSGHRYRPVGHPQRRLPPAIAVLTIGGRTCLWRA